MRGELYLAGLNSTTISLPDVATDVKASGKAIEQLKMCAKAMLVRVPNKKLEVLREGLVCSPVLSQCYSLMTSITVLSTRDLERPSASGTDTGRKARRCEDSRERRGRSFHRSWARCLGHIACAWHWACAFRVA
jgi:hypothetical protein